MQPNSNSDFSSASNTVQGVNASSRGLLKATLGAAVAAGAILTFVWLPAEYGIDPTGTGHLLGLTEMGHIKNQLHIEADADAAAARDASNGISDANALQITQQLESIQTQLDAISAAVGSRSTASAATQTTETSEPTVEWRDESSHTLKPGEGTEVKMVMEEGATAEFEWSANGAVVNHDTHGDAHGKSISYKKGRSVPEQTGELTAAFTGNHGWYWRNRTTEDVVITLRTRGDYKGMWAPGPPIQRRKCRNSLNRQTIHTCKKPENPEKTRPSILFINGAAIRAQPSHLAAFAFTTQDVRS